MVSRRAFVCGAAAMIATEGSRTAAGAPVAAPQAPSAELKSIAGAATPISGEERRARIAKLQALMKQQKIGALLIESGSTLDYFTGIRWRRSERTTAALIPAGGGVVVVTPAFEEPSVRETLVGGVRRVSNAYDIVSGDALVRACRLIKSPAELALMQTANDVTLAALRFVHARIERGMRPSDLAILMNDSTTALGGTPEFSLVLLNEASAYPHGSEQAQSVREGSIVLMDCGCTVHGYQSDISRTWVFGTASARQRKVWNTVKRGQEIALGTAKIGAEVGRIDDAVRRYYESEGWGPAYKLPGLSHRTGHGIGLDGHEPAYLVHGDATPLQPGMCFSDEPGIYIPGEFGVRLEDCWHMTASGPQTFTPLAASLDEPI